MCMNTGLYVRKYCFMPILCDVGTCGHVGVYFNLSKMNAYDQQ